MNVASKRFTIYPFVKGEEHDPIEDVSNFKREGVLTYVKGEPTYSTWEIKILRNIDKKDIGVYCEVVINVDEFDQSDVAFINLEIDGLVHYAQNNLHVVHPEELGNDTQPLIDNLTCKISSWIRELNPEIKFDVI